MSIANDLFSQALNLPPEKRGELAFFLLESLPEDERPIELDPVDDGKRVVGEARPVVVVVGRPNGIAMAALVERVAVEVAEALRHRPPHHAVEAGGMGHEDGRSLAAKVPGGHVEAV